jgi:hypothetical protein
MGNANVKNRAWLALLDFARWIELKYRLTFALNLVQFWQLQEGWG